MLSLGLKRVEDVFNEKRRSNYTLPQTSLSNFLSGICDAQNVHVQIFCQDNPAMLFNSLQCVFTATGIAVVTHWFGSNWTGLKPVYNLFGLLSSHVSWDLLTYRMYSNAKVRKNVMIWKTNIFSFIRQCFVDCKGAKRMDSNGPTSGRKKTCT